ncbi:MAG: mechanosensitive ion channel family protein [Gemmiger sp.]
MTDWTTTFNRWRASLVGYGSFFRVGLAAALVLAGVFGARVMRRLFNQVRSLLTAHTPEWVHILVDGFQEPCVLLMRAGLWYCAAYAFPWPAGWMVSVYAIANKAMRVSFMLLIAWGIWNSSPLCGLLLKSAQNHLDLESNRTMRSFFEKVYRVLVVLMTLIAVAGEFTDVTALITGAGLAGLTVSLAAQNAVADLVAGVSLVLEHPFGLGDWIVVGGAEGAVEDISFRSTKLRTADNALITIKNSAIYAANIQNIAGRESRLWTFQLGVTYSTPRERLESLCEALRGLLNNQPEVCAGTVEVNLSEFADSSINVEIRCYVKTTGPVEFRELKNRLNLSIMDVMNAEGCEFAFPSASVYLEKS